MLNFFIQQQGDGRRVDEFLHALQSYFARPMSDPNKVLAVVLLVVVILLILFLMVRTIIFIWKGDNKKTLL